MLNGNTLVIPAGTFVVTVGASGSGKSTFLRRVPAEAVVSSDGVRHELSGDASKHANEPRVWRTVYERIHDRLGRGLTTVLDSTAAAPSARRSAIEAARAHGAPLLFLAFNTPLAVSLARNRARQDPQRSEPVPELAIRKHHSQVAQFLHAPDLEEGQHLIVLTPKQADRLEVQMPLDPVPRRRPALQPSHNPVAEPERYAIVGDVHGCLDELEQLLTRPELGDGRQIVFAGDLPDRGPDSLGVLRRTMALGEAGRARCVRGNHDDKLARLLDYVYGKGLTWTSTPLSVDYGLQTTIAEFQRLEAQQPAEAERLARRVIHYVRTMPYHLVLDQGRLVVSHGGIPEHLIGAEGPHLRRYALYGNPSGELDERGFPIRADLALTYQGSALNVHGHIAVPPPPAIRNNVCNVDTSAVFGGALTALLYPERTFVSIPAARVYYEH